MPKYRLTRRASRDVDEIWAYIAQDNPVAAGRMLDAFVATFESIATNPKAGHTRTEVTTSPVLFRRVREYQIIYDPRKRPVQIIAVLHGRRDLAKVLRGR